MKWKGQTPQRNSGYCVIPREFGDDIVLKLEAVLDFAEFETLCPEPEPPIMRFPGERPDAPNFQDPGYLEAMAEHSKLRTSWLVLRTLTPNVESGDLEWETVNMQDSTTWEGWMVELMDSGFTDAEVGLIINKCMQVNAFDSDRLQAAEEDFLAGKLGL